MIYKIRVCETLSYCFEVEADSPIAAEITAEEMAQNRDVEIDEDIIERSISVGLCSDTGFDVSDDGLDIF